MGMKIFITGISRGLGLSLAEECAARGHEVWGIARHRPVGVAWSVRFSACDLAVQADIDKVYNEIIGADFVPDAVILNAAAIKDDIEEVIDIQTLIETFEVNVFGNLRFLNLFLPALRNGGIFMNVSSVVTIRAFFRKGRMVAYPASKAAMDKVFEGLRIRCRGRARFITVNLGPLNDKGVIPLLTSNYNKTAALLINGIESGKIKDSFCYPYAAGVVYKFLRAFPDTLISRMCG